LKTAGRSCAAVSHFIPQWVSWLIKLQSNFDFNHGKSRLILGINEYQWCKRTIQCHFQFLTLSKNNQSMLKYDGFVNNMWMIAELTWKGSFWSIYATTRVNSFTIFLLSLCYCRQNLCQVNRQFFRRTSWWSRYVPFFVWCLMEFRYPI
jgi:hypothetical protein